MDSSCRILPSIQLTYISSTVSLMCKGLCLSRDFSGLVESEHEYNRVWIKQICVLNCSHHIPDWTFHLWLKYWGPLLKHGKPLTGCTARCPWANCLPWLSSPSTLWWNSFQKWSLAKCFPVTTTILQAFTMAQTQCFVYSSNWCTCLRLTAVDLIGSFVCLQVEESMQWTSLWGKE